MFFIDPVTSYIWKNSQFQKYRENNRLYNISKIASSKHLIVVNDKNVIVCGDTFLLYYLIIKHFVFLLQKNLNAYTNAEFAESNNLSKYLHQSIHFEVEQNYVILFKKNQTECLTIDIIEVNIDKTLKGKLKY